MLVFASPLWLIALAPLAVLGALALRRERSAPVAVPTLRFWQGSTTQSAGRRPSNWRWLPLVLAALLIPMTLAEPLWRPTLSSQRVLLHAAMRAMPGAGGAELFVQMERPAWIAPDESLAVVASDDVTGKPALTQPVSARTLATGASFEVPLTARMVVSVSRHDRLASVLLAQKTSHAFTIDARANAPLLERVLKIQPGFVPHHRDAARKLIVVDAATATPSTLKPAAGEFLIALGRVGLSGARYTGSDRKLTGSIHSAGKDGSLANVDFDDARVRRMVPAEFDATWRVLAKATDLPFMALRTDHAGGRTLWISSLDHDATAWPLHPSFVVFFTNIVNEWLATDTSAEPQWQIMPDPQSTGHTPIALSRYAGGMVLLCLIAGASLLITRK